MITAIINNEITKTTLLLCVLETENIERMEKHDPVHSHIVRMQQEVGRATGRPGAAIEYPESLEFVIAYEQDWPSLLEEIEKGGIRSVLIYLNRGWVRKPSDGDPPTLIKAGAE